MPRRPWLEGHLLQRSLDKYLCCILPLDLEGQTHGPLQTNEFWDASPNDLARTAWTFSRIFRIGLHGKDTPSNLVDTIPERGINENIVCCARGDGRNV